MIDFLNRKELPGQNYSRYPSFFTYMGTVGVVFFLMAGLTGCGGENDNASGAQLDLCRLLSPKVTVALVGTKIGAPHKSATPAPSPDILGFGADPKNCRWDNPYITGEFRYTYISISKIVSEKDKRRLSKGKSCRSIEIDEAEACWYGAPPRQDLSIVISKDDTTMKITCGEPRVDQSTAKRASTARRIAGDVTENIDELH